MTRFFDATFEGASLTGANGASSVVASPALDSTSLMKGTYCIGYSASTQYARFDITASDDVYVSAYIYLTSVANSIRSIYITNGVRLDIRSNRALRLADSGGTQIGSDSAVLSLNTLYRVGVHWRKATGAGNDGQAEAYVTATGSPDAAFGSAFASSTTLTQTAQLSRVDVGNTSGATANSWNADDIRIDNASMPGPSVSSTQVDTTYTAGVYVVKRTDNNYTAGTFLQKTSNNNYTAGVVAASVISSSYTAGVVVNMQPQTSYTAGVPVKGTIDTPFTAKTIAQGTFNNNYTAGVVASLLNSIAYTAGVSLSAVINNTYTVGVAIAAAPIQLFYPYPYSTNRDETSFWLCDAFGNVQYVIEPDEYISGGYQLAVNQVTRMNLQLPGTFPYELLVQDAWVLPVRCVNGSPGRIDANQVFLVSQRSRKDSGVGQKLIEFQAETANTILKRRIVAYDAETSQADKTGLADNLMLAYMRENFGSSAVDVARRVNTYLDIIGDQSLGSTVNYAGSRKTLEAVLNDLARASADASKPLYYEVALSSIGGRKLVFRVVYGQRGTNRTSEVLLSQETGTLMNVVLTEDYTKGWNYVYAIGKGTEQQQLIKTASDTDSIGSGPFARIERSVSATDAETEAQVQTKANQNLRLGRKKKQYAAEIPDSGIYGSLVFFGDNVNADLDGVALPVMVSAVDVKVGPGGDKVRLALRTEV